MDEARAREILTDIELTMNGLQLETMYRDGVGGTQLGDTLCVAFPLYDASNEELVDALSDEERVAQTAFMEVILLRFDENERYCFQFYTTILREMACEPAELERTAMEINFFCPIGDFGVFRSERQFFHKYGMMFDEEKNVTVIATAAMMAIEAIADMVDTYYDLVRAIANKETTLDKAIANGELRVQPE
jgi:hypothetical protein